MKTYNLTMPELVKLVIEMTDEAKDYKLQHGTYGLELIIEHHITCEKAGIPDENN
ncbi:hypothetical protein LCGC14_2143270 [marine sediment metagenome]|uniref:Uncharacterized protein n=1 Tax=marine sediment metagenome TaxID=412755 RepID=A0A0F9GAR1_9ZZZZ